MLKERCAFTFAVFLLACIVESAAECGVPRFPINPKAMDYEKIVGGEEANPHSLPWQILLKKSGYFACGGSVLSDNWVITAAHCLYPRSPLTIEAGIHDQNSPGSSAQIRTVKRIISHEHYDRDTNDNDIALLELSSPLILNGYVQPICIPEEDVHGGVESLVSGWGTTGNGKISSRLQQVYVPITNQTYCRMCNGPTVTDNMLCAGLAEGGIDTCQGDSGGPLICHMPARNAWVLQGITSWGYGCAEPNQPGVYTRVSNYKAWIEQQMGEAETEQKISPQRPAMLNSPCTGDGQLITGETSGTIMSDGFDGSGYEDNMDCSWQIHVAESAQIVLTLNAIHIESHSSCEYDALKVYDGPSAEAELIATYCGNEQNYDSIKSTHNILYVRFTTDYSETRRGFFASFSSVLPYGNCAPAASNQIVHSEEVLRRKLCSPSDIYPPIFHALRVRYQGEYTVESDESVWNEFKMTVEAVYLQGATEVMPGTTIIVRERRLCKPLNLQDEDTDVFLMYGGHIHKETRDDRVVSVFTAYYDTFFVHYNGRRLRSFISLLRRGYYRCRT